MFLSLYLVLEVASGEYGNKNKILVEKSANGLNLDWRKTQRNSLQFQSMELVGKSTIFH